MPTTPPPDHSPSQRADDAIPALTSLIAPIRHALVVSNLADAVALAHRFTARTVAIAVAPVAIVESAIPYDAYIATSGTNATAHVAIAHARPIVLELALTCPRFSLPEETDCLNIPVE